MKNDEGKDGEGHFPLARVPLDRSVDTSFNLSPAVFAGAESERPRGAAVSEQVHTRTAQAHTLLFFKRHAF